MSEAPDPIASRIVKADGEPVFQVHVHASVLELDSNTRRCRYQFDGSLTRRWHYALGADSMQALVLALQIISVALEFCEENEAGRLGFFTERGDFRLPGDAAGAGAYRVRAMISFITSLLPP